MVQDKWELLSVEVKKLVIEAAKIIKDSFETELIVEFKANPNDLVTEMDREIEAHFKNAINKEYPDHRILGEEGTGKDLKDLAGIVWIIDPIDGTTNFVHQKRHFAISVGIYEDGVGMLGVIYDVMADEIYLAIRGKGASLNNLMLPKIKETVVSEALIAINPGWIVEDERLMQLVRDCRGTRSYGAAAIEMAAVAANRLDAYISLNLSPWDFAAGAIILRELGAHISTIDGKELNFLEPSSLCVTTPKLYEQFQGKYF